MAESNVVYENTDIQPLDELFQCGVVAVLVLREVHSEGLDGDLGAIFAGDIGGEGLEFGGCTRYEEEIVAFACEGEGEFFADAVGGTSNQGPRATGTELSELVVFLERDYISVQRLDLQIHLVEQIS